VRSGVSNSKQAEAGRAPGCVCAAVRATCEDRQGGVMRSCPANRGSRCKRERVGVRTERERLRQDFDDSQNQDHPKLKHKKLSRCCCNTDRDMHLNKKRSAPTYAKELHFQGFRAQQQNQRNDEKRTTRARSLCTAAAEVVHRPSIHPSALSSTCVAGVTNRPARRTLGPRSCSTCHCTAVAR